MVITISIALKKGGSGKTTTAVNLAAHLARLQKRTLVIDVDSQCNVSTACGIQPISAPDYDNPVELPLSLMDVLKNKNLPVENAIITTDFGFDILPSRGDLSQAELGMNFSHIYILKSRLESIRERYDYILIDTPPNDQYMTSASLIASNSVLIPFQAQKFALEGIREFMKIVEEIQNFRNNSLEVLGFLPTMLIRKTIIAEAIMQNARKLYGNRVLPFEIYTTVQIQNAQLIGQPLLFYDEKHPANAVYENLAKFIINKYRQ
jgi:chromosome partitioning protein